MKEEVNLRIEYEYNKNQIIFIALQKIRNFSSNCTQISY